MYKSCMRSDHPSVHICQKQPETNYARKTHKLIKGELKKLRKEKKRKKRKRRKGKNKFKRKQRKNKGRKKGTTGNIY